MSRALLALCASTVWGSAVAADPPPSGGALFQRMLSHVTTDRPVHGTATVKRTLNPEYYAEVENSLKGKKFTVEPRDQLLVCRWAWDGARELVEAKAGSVEREDAFLRMKEGAVFFTGTSNGSRRYTVEKTEVPLPSRPQSFYYRLAGDKLWQELAANFDAGEVRPVSDDLVTLELLDARKSSPVFSALVTLNPRTGVPRGWKVYLDKKLVYDLSIAGHHDLGQGRTFPSSATQTFYKFDTGKWWGRDELACETASLGAPASGEDPFKLVIPAGSVISDNITNASSVTTSDVSAGDVVARAGGSGVVPLDRQAVKERGTAIPEANRPRLVNLLAAAGLLAVAAFLIFRRPRRPGGDASGPPQAVTQ